MTDTSEMEEANEASCKHERLAFGSGGYYVFCCRCKASWMAVSDNDKPDYTRGSAQLGPEDYRDG